MGGDLPPPWPTPPPPEPPAPVPRRRTNGMAIASLCCALATPLFPLAWILGLIFGYIALRQIRDDPTQTGRGLAIAGVVIGWVIVASVVVGVFALVLVD